MATRRRSDRRVTALLHVHPGDGAARSAFDRERRVAWATALPVVLEKHGYLDVASCAAEDAPAAIASGAPAVVVVTRLAPEQWTDELVATLLAGPFAVLCERPPAALHAALGIATAAPAPHEGRLVACAPGFERAVRERAGAAAAKIAGPISHPVPIDPALLWPATGAPIAPDRAAAWNAPGWSAERWSVDAATTVLAEWQSGAGGASAAVVRRGRMAATAVELLAYLAQAHSGAPYDGPEHRNWPRTLAAEAMLLELIDSLHAAAGASRVRVLPWPRDVRWALNVRHDVDRLPARGDLRRLLARHDAAATRATLYVRPRHLTADRAFLARAAVRRLLGHGAGEPPRRPGGAPYLGPGAPARALRSTLASLGHELALHSEGVWDGGDAEVDAFAAAFGRPPAGSCSHGAPDCFRFQGAPNVLWADAAGLDYTELILHTHLQPHRFPALAADGTITVLRTLCLPHHESFDRPGSAPPTGAEAILGRIDLWRRAGGLLQVMSHPDLNRDELFDFLAQIPREGRLDTTAAAAADWWRRSHVAGELELTTDRAGGLRMWSRRGVEDLALSVLAPDGRERTLDVALAADEARTMALEGIGAR